MKKILIVGCGSIGERHLRCFQQTGRAEVVACDANPVLLQQVCARYDVQGVVDFQTALADPTLDGVVIATPAHVHVPMASTALEAGRHVFIEKPLSVRLEGVEELRDLHRRSGLVCAIAYTYRSMAVARALKSAIDAMEYGPPLVLQIEAGQHFPHFRPAYREIYFNNHATGGGAIQDGITHLVNLVEWLVGPLDWIFCDAAHQALDGVEVEDTAIITGRSGETMVHIAFNLFQAPNENQCTMHCKDGSIRGEFHCGRWGTMPLGSDQWKWSDVGESERDAIYIFQAQAFLDLMEGKPNHLATLEDGIQTLRVNLAALESARSRQVIDLRTPSYP